MAVYVDSPAEKSSGVDNFPQWYQTQEKKFLKFCIMHKKSEVFPAGRLYCFRLADGKAL